MVAAGLPITQRDAITARSAAHTGDNDVPGRFRQAGLMSMEGLSGLVDRIIAWADGLQRRHGVLGFPYAVVKKYGDDGGGRQAALITYYGFLSIFPLLLLGVAVLSRVLADHPDLRQRLIAAIVPQALRSTVEHSLATLPTSTIPFVVGLVGLLFSGTGVVFSAYQTLNHVAAVRHRLRAGFFSRYVRVFVVLAMLLFGALATGALTVVATALPGQPAVQRAGAVLGSALIVFALLLLGAKLLLARSAPVRALWPGAILGAVAVTVVLNAGAPLLARLVAKAGPVYGSFATVAGMFALLYLVGQALVYAAEVAAVRYARLWPRALDLKHPTAPMLARGPCWRASRNASPPPASSSTSQRMAPRQPMMLHRNAAILGKTGPTGPRPLISWLTVGPGAGLGGPGIRRGVVAVRCPACAAEQCLEGQQDHASHCHSDTSSGQDVQRIVHP